MSEDEQLRRDADDAEKNDEERDDTGIARPASAAETKAAEQSGGPELDEEKPE